MDTSSTAKQVAENARLAATAANETATAIALVGNDVNWMKRSLSGIEVKLDEMSKSYITAAQHADVLKTQADQEIRLGRIETNDTRHTVMLSIGGAILLAIVGILIKLVLDK